MQNLILYRMIYILLTGHTHKEQNSLLNVVPTAIVTHYGTNIAHHSIIQVCPGDWNNFIGRKISCWIGISWQNYPDILHKAPVCLSFIESHHHHTGVDELFFLINLDTKHVRVIFSADWDSAWNSTSDKVVLVTRTCLNNLWEVCFRYN
jgi:hypothetical protein